MVKHNREFRRRLTAAAAILLLTSLFLAIPLSSEQPVTEMSPSVEAEADFVVYPDNSVALMTAGNVTANYSMFGGSSPTYHVEAQLSKSDGRNEASANATVALSPEQTAQFPYNSATASFIGHYSNGLTNSSLNASMVLPSSLSIPGMPSNLSLGFPFDSLDFSLSAAGTSQSFNGTVTAHLVPGFTLGDVHVDFEGNLSQVVISDSVKVFYNYTLPIPGFPILNETYLSQMLQSFNDTFPGRGPGSVYNMTLGMLECTTFNTTITAIDANSATVSFLIIIQGDFAGYLANMYSQLLSTPGSIPLFAGMSSLSLNTTALSELFKASFNSTKSWDLTMSYSKANRRFNMETDSTWDQREYWNETVAILPTLYPPQMQPFIESIFNTTYASLNSMNETMTYSNGLMNMSFDALVTGDLNAEVNYFKNAFLNITAQAGLSQDMMSVLKETEVDVASLKASFDVQNNSESWSLENIKVSPPTDPINATSFKLTKFFNFTKSPYEPPIQNQQLRLVVQGGSNGTHTVTLSNDPNDPDKPPNPDEFGSNNTMIWNNMSLSKLRSLIFTIRPGYAETIFNSTAITQTNPFTIDAKESAGCKLTVTNISKPATISIQNTTSPPDVGSTPTSYKVLGNYVQVTSDSTDMAVNATIFLYYTPEQLAASGLSENDLKIFYWDTTTSSWTAANTNINSTEHCAWTVVNHLSAWAIMGQPGQPIWQQLWFVVAIVVALAALIIIAGAIVMRRRKACSEMKKEETSKPTT